MEEQAESEENSSKLTKRSNESRDWLSFLKGKAVSRVVIILRIRRRGK